ncbi:MAG: hypothetical protein SV760_01490 [Halobacteria archaeon]|nr:hypothetical protein [Halobacteria archaeon]
MNDQEFDRLGQEERRDVVGFWRTKFGVPSGTFDGYDLYKKGESKVWITTESADVDELNYESAGLPFLRVNQEHPKPTTDALQRFGGEATKNVVSLGDDEARRFVSGETVEREFDVDSLGYVVVKYDGDVLGCGLYFPGELRSQIPKGRRVELDLG